MDFHKPDTTTTTSAARRAAAMALIRDQQRAKYDQDRDMGDGNRANYDDDTNQDDSEEKKPRTDSGGGGGRRISGGGGGGGSMSCCQADKCTVDLTEVKRYHRRHKVCELHAKAPAVLVSGIPQRFCQQCSRFHELAEFDDTKRSCRRRLAGHNERRRKSTSDPNGGSGSSSGRVKDPGPHCRPADHERPSANRTGQMASYGGNSSFKLR